MDHPYPDHAFLERDPETNEKRWFSSLGMGVRYIHEDRAAEDIEAAVKAEREACAKLADTGMLYGTDGGSPTQDEIDVAQRIAAAIRSRQ